MNLRNPARLAAVATFISSDSDEDTRADVAGLVDLLLKVIGYD